MVPALAKLRNKGIEVAPAWCATTTRGRGPATPRKARRVEFYIVIGGVLVQAIVLIALDFTNEKTRRELRRVSRIGEGRAQVP